LELVRSAGVAGAVAIVLAYAVFRLVNGLINLLNHKMDAVADRLDRLYQSNVELQREVSRLADNVRELLEEVRRGRSGGG